jgi:8-oxo-dGTP pyrophosphatase MutT (NUDIX family)
MNGNQKPITIQDIISALSLKLPAAKAHEKLLPEGRSLDFPYDKISTIKESAVLILLFKKEDELYLCLTRRNHNLKHHPGQISFPGGKIDHNDDDAIKTALRELNEETGVEGSIVSICGKLSDLYITVSNFLIHPVVGFLDHEPMFEMNHDEVDEIIVIPLVEFFGDKNITQSTVETPFGKIKAPCFSIDGHIIWGATAMIISELTELLSTFSRLKE